MYCGNCGQQLPEDSDFCMYCGTAVQKRNNKKEETLKLYKKSRRKKL